jgi:hypothetical protein
MIAKNVVKAMLFRPGYREHRVLGGALKGMSFTFDLRRDTRQWRGLYEQALQDWLMRYVKWGDVCLDIGAARGYFSLLMAKLAGPQGRVYAFEPSPLHQDIQAHLNLNREYLLAPVGICDSFVVGPGCSCERQITIDEFVAREQLAHVNIVKIDVDGPEVEVLRGMADTLRRFRPHLFVEVHSRDLLAQVEQITSQHGYTMELKHPHAREHRPTEFNAFYQSRQ